MTWEMALGRLRIVAIEDGYFSPPPEYFFPSWDWSAVHDVPVAEDGSLRIGLGCYLIEGPFGLVMVDTGGGPNERSPDPFTTGRLPAELGALGVGMDDIDGIIHTHLHFDHWGGDIDAAGQAAFGQAMIHLHEDELAWATEERSDQIADFSRLAAEGRVRTAAGEGEVYPGVSILETRGHTPGHISVAIDGGDASALILGDVSHHPAQLQHPTWNVRFDVDPERAAATRVGVLDRLTDGPEVLMGGHWPGPGWGRVVTAGSGREFRPI